MAVQVAAYKNKVMNWRAKIETDINEVLQVTTVFQNVSKVSSYSRSSLYSQLFDVNSLI